MRRCTDFTVHLYLEVGILRLGLDVVQVGIQSLFLRFMTFHEFDGGFDAHSVRYYVLYSFFLSRHCHEVSKVRTEVHGPLHGICNPFQHVIVLEIATEDSADDLV